MLYSSTQINKLIKKIQEEISALKSNESKIVTYTYGQGENPEEVKYEYSFIGVQDEISRKEGDVRLLKHLLNVFNVNTRIDELDMTIDQLLVALPQLNERLNKYAIMKARLPKERLNAGYAHSNAPAVEYRCVNYDLEEVARSYNSLRDFITRAQILLDEVNSRECIEVPIAEEATPTEPTTEGNN